MRKIKNLLSSPKKLLTTSAIAIVVVFILGFGIFNGAKTIAQGQAIGVENARNFAFADSGVDPAEAKFVVTEFDFEQGQFVYEVEFVANGVEYDYWIKSTDGSIVKKKSNFVNRDAAIVQMNTSVEEARSIALADAQVDIANASITKETFVEDDGNYVYSIKFHTSTNRYEYEIDVNNGNIVNKVQDQLAIIANPETTAETATSENKQRLTIEQVKQVVLTKSGLSADEVKFTKVELDKDDDDDEYDIEFYSDTHKYEYEIDAYTGRIKEREIESFNKPATVTTPTVETSTNTGSDTSSNTNPGTSTASNQPMSQAKAKEVILKHANLKASEVTFTEIELEKDDGRWEYEVEFKTSLAKYEYEINAVTGKILDVEVERFKSSGSNSSTTTSYIGTEKAKSIALSHAKLSASQVRFEKVKLDKDDGIYYYELEFYANGLEYEYEIHAISGKIVDWEIDD